jgi:alanine racemase
MRTWAEISLARLTGNYRKILEGVAAGVTVSAVVKANAYGHGAVQVARALEAEWLDVSNVAEGVELRLAGIGGRILVLGGVLEFERAALLEHGLTPVVHSLGELREWDAMGRAIAVHLKVDTGMARLGMIEAPAAIAAAVAGLKCVHLEGVMSHLATPTDAVQSAAQEVVFAEVVQSLHPEVVHFASSFALADAGCWMTLVRPGIALYGYAPVFGVEPVLTWKARVVGVKHLRAGATIGYNARYRAERDMRTAVIAAGYADGVRRSLTNRGRVEINGFLAPIVGAVSMDLTTVDVTECGTVSVGDEATIIGARYNADDMARDAETISYEILTGIGNRVVRVYNSDL